MFKFVILLSAVACALGAAIPEGMLPQLDGRIVGGTATNIANYPFIVSVQRGGRHSCGGSIYSPTVIVTAAHCLQNVLASAISIRAGSTYSNSGGTIIKASGFKNHEGYNAGTMVNDIAVIRLASSLSYGSTIRNIGLATSTPANGASAVVTGWGTTSSGGSASTTLLYTFVNIVGLSDCGTKFGYANTEIRPTMICAKGPGKDACQGDSGGPLAAGGLLAGVVSWGYGCAAANYPGVYADVAVLRSWIVNNS